MLNSRKLGIGSIIAMTLISVANIRNLPNIAADGPILVFAITMAALCFLLPVTIAASFLSSQYQESGGVYVWVRGVFSKRVAFCAAWLQWVENVFYYPVLLIYIAKNFLAIFFLNNQDFDQLTILIIPVVFFAMTYINTKGLLVSAMLSRLCTYFGLLLPLGFIIFYLGYQVFSGQVSLLSLAGDGADFQVTDYSGLLVNSIVMFCGVEIATVHAAEVRDAKSTYPKAIFLSGIIVYLFMILGALGLLFAANGAKIEPLTGMVQYFDFVFGSVNHVVIIGVTLMILLGQIGSLNNWVISPVKALFFAINDHEKLSCYLDKDPESGLNKLLWLQAALVMLICLFYYGVSSAVGYFIFNQLIVLLYMPMYMIVLFAMFCQSADASDVFAFRGWGFVKNFLAILGIISCLVVLIFSIIYQPAIFLDFSYLGYLAMILLPWLLCLMVPIFLLRYYDAKPL